MVFYYKISLFLTLYWIKFLALNIDFQGCHCLYSQIPPNHYGFETLRKWNCFINHKVFIRMVYIRFSPINVEDSKAINKRKVRCNCIKLLPVNWSIPIQVISLEDSLKIDNSLFCSRIISAVILIQCTLNLEKNLIRAQVANKHTTKSISLNLNHLTLYQNTLELLVTKLGRGYNRTIHNQPHTSTMALTCFSTVSLLGVSSTPFAQKANSFCNDVGVGVRDD